MRRLSSDEDSRVRELCWSRHLGGRTDQLTQTMQFPSVLLCKGCTTSQGLLLILRRPGVTVCERRGLTYSLVSRGVSVCRGDEYRVGERLRI